MEKPGFPAVLLNNIMPSPKMPTRPPAPPQSQQAKSKVSFAPIPATKGHRVLLYGPGGIGKTTLACQAPGTVAVIDADESLGILKSQLTAQEIQIPKLVPASNWAEVRTALQSDGWNGINTIVIDTATKLEEWCVAHMIKTVKHEKGHVVHSIEDYGFGKGFQFVFDTWLNILGDLDRHVRAGRNVILVAHDCVSNVPNPNGEDWIRYEPRLQDLKSGKASIRLRCKEWCDHVLFVGYDVAVKEKKAQGSGTRTMYTAELPFCMAKSRTTNEQFNIELGQENPWEQIIK
jgi:hypothetical protein